MKENWTIEDVAVDTMKCACCGSSHKVVSGFVRDDDGTDVAMYVANFLDHQDERRVELKIGLFPDLRAPVEKMKKQFAVLLLRKHQGKVATSVISKPDDTEGMTMTREEVLASPRKRLVFEIDDFVLAHDGHIQPFLDGTDG
jgi:hypothetical protein